MILYINIYKVKHGMMNQMVTELNASGVEEIFRGIPGNIDFNYSVAIKDEDTFYLTDLWQDEESFNAHMQSDALHVWHTVKDKYIVDKKVTRYDF